MLDASDDATDHDDARDGARRLAAAEDRGPGIDLVLPVVIAGPYVDFVPRPVGMPEDDEVGLGKPTSQTCPPAGRTAAVVDHRYGASTELEREPVG